MYSIELMTKPVRTRQIKRDNRGRFKAPGDAGRDQSAQPPQWQGQQGNDPRDGGNAQQR